MIPAISYSSSAAQKSSSLIRVLDGAQWTLVGLIAAVALLLPLTGASAHFAILILTVLFAAIHGVRRYGWSRFIAFFVITFVVSNAFENLSVETGFPFGNYHYNGDLKLFHVPIFIGPMYFGIGYVSWLTASTILDRADEKLDLRSRVGRVNAFILPVLAGAVMTMFDVGSDSQAATINKVWTWEEGGGLFGVPYTNYLGWWFVTYVFFQIQTLILARSQSHSAEPSNPVINQSLLQPVIVYLSLGLTSIPFFYSTLPHTDVDGSGVAWNVLALNESMMIINIFSLVVIAFIAVAKIARGNGAADA